MAELISFNDHNLGLVYNLSRLGIDMDDIALYFGLSKNQFDAVCENHPEFREMYDKGKSVRAKLNGSVGVGDG